MRPSRRRRLRLAAVTVVVAAAVGTTVGFTRGGSSHTYEGSALTPPLRTPATVLTDTAGHPTALTDSGGKATLVYFGYTHCPDLCPTTMADVHQALEHVSAQVRDDVRVVFVTVDPQHDTPSVIRRWLDDFDPAFVGLTGRYDDILAAGNALDAGVSATPPKTVNGVVDVQHGSTLVGLTPHGGAPVYYIPAVDGSYQGPDLQKQLEHDLPLLESGVGGRGVDG